MVHIRGWGVVAAAALLAAILVWSLAEEPGPIGGAEPAQREAPLPPALSAPRENVAPTDGAARTEGARSAETARGVAPPADAVDGPKWAPRDELRAALRAHDVDAAKELLADVVEPRDVIYDLVNLVRYTEDLVTQLMAVQVLASIQGEAASAALMLRGEMKVFPSAGRPRCKSRPKPLKPSQRDRTAWLTGSVAVRSTGSPFGSGAYSLLPV